jgi:hypothetical protein
MLAWHILSTGKPYRYAKPATVEAKLQKLRVAGSGEKRRGGVAKGIDPRTTRDPSEQQMRRTAKLNDVLAREGLPEPSELKPGEALQEADAG